MLLPKITSTCLSAMTTCAPCARIALRLLWNGLRYRFLRWTSRPGRPQALSLELTRSCVCHCVMCNIWRTQPPRPELRLEEWTKLLSDPVLRDLRELDLTGGEPFLWPDLVSLLKTVCRLKTGYPDPDTPPSPASLKKSTGKPLRNLRSVAITTNGVLTGRVLADVKEALPCLAEAGLELVVVCALDAVGELHDRIRRCFGAWDCVQKTLAGLIALRSEHPNLVLGIKTTVLPENVDQLGAIAQYARERKLFTIISPAIVTPGRYANTELARRLTLGQPAREQAAVFYEGQDFRWSYHARALARYLRGRPMEKPCTCGFNYLFVRADGTVFLCPLADESQGAAGNLREAPLAALLSSRRARAIRRRIGQRPECESCTEPGLERYSLPYDGLAYLRLLFALGPKAFLEHHRHLGLDKYV